MELMTNNNSLSLEAEKKIISLKQAYKNIKEQEEAFNQALVDEMKKRGIISYKDENITISFIPDGTKNSFDAKAFKSKHPDIYERYVKKSPVKEYARITLKKGINVDNMQVPINVETQKIEVVGDEKAF